MRRCSRANWPLAVVPLKICSRALRALASPRGQHVGYAASAPVEWASRGGGMKQRPKARKRKAKARKEATKNRGKPTEPVATAAATPKMQPSGVPAKLVRDLCAPLFGDSRPTFEELWRLLTAWPPDMFALTSHLLSVSEAYRLVVSPPASKQWAPTKDWATTVEHAGKEWRKWLGKGDANAPLPNFLVALKPKLEAMLDLPAADLRSGSDWVSSCALFELHAVADEASAGVGIPGMLDDPVGISKNFYSPAHVRLSDFGSLSNCSVSVMRVLPKMRTPQSGITLRSLSHHLCGLNTAIDVSWLTGSNVGPEKTEDLHVLIVPWPFKIDEHDFVPTPGPLDNLNRDLFGFFTFEPKSHFDLTWFEKAVAASIARCGRVDGVIFPECSLSQTEFVEAEELLQKHGVKFILAGVRGDRRNVAKLVAFNRGDRKLNVTAEQHKHHRWCLDASQIKQYQFAKVFDPEKRWWEDIEIAERKMHFFTASSWLTMCHLICEDLARVDPVSQVVRAVGPTLLIALLEDGPQLEGRWPARYATVMADDPGTSVLTLTSLGMATRSKRLNDLAGPPNRTVALWRDARTGTKVLTLDPQFQALALSLKVHWHEEWSADGRRDDRRAAHLVYREHEGIP